MVVINDYLCFNDLKWNLIVNFEIPLLKSFQKADFGHKITVIPLYQNDGYSLAESKGFEPSNRG